MKIPQNKIEWLKKLIQRPGTRWAGLAVALLALAGLLLKGHHPQSQASANDPTSEDAAETATLPLPTRTAQLPPSPLNALLQPDLSPERQVSIVGQMLLDYWTSVRSLPSGTWEEVYAALAGENRKAMHLIPHDHPALGPDGFQSAEDGPSIRLHVVSSRDGVFQLIHSGADAEHYTDDDLICNFPPNLATITQL
ncbi:MAG: hypothetical protein ACI9R3_004877 [Verrucomicrobiales bacterium]|jgi:hypothetical protein